MSNLKRFSVSLDKKLLAKFDKHIRDKNCPTRSKAIADFIKEILVKKEWLEGKNVAGAIILVYDHHKRNLVNKLTDIQHNFHQLVVATQHIHLDHNNCLEIVIVKGESKKLINLSNKLRATKGLKHGSLTITTTGKKIP